MQPFVAAIVWMLWRLRCAAGPRGEQVAIGIGARMGNGLLLTILSYLVVRHSGGSPADASAAALVLAAAFLFELCVAFVLRPQKQSWLQGLTQLGIG